MQMYNQQGITENYPQYTTNFWGDAGNNYGFGSSNISSAISAHPAMNTTPTPLQTQNNNVQQLTMPAGSQYQITMPRPQKPSAWDKFKILVENKVVRRDATFLIDMDRNIRSAALDDLLPSDSLDSNIH